MSDRQQWACDRCGAVYYLAEKPKSCNSCLGQREDVAGARIPSEHHTTFTAID